MGEICGTDAMETEEEQEREQEEAGCAGETAEAEAESAAGPETETVSEAAGDPAAGCVEAAAVTEAYDSPSLVRDTGPETGREEAPETQIVNQILATELPGTPPAQTALEAAEAAHRQSIDQILEGNGKYMSAADRARVSAGAEDLGVTEYGPPGVLGTCCNDVKGGRSSIDIMTFDRDLIEHTAKHETNHFASHMDHVLVPEPARDGYTMYITEGFLHYGYFHSNAEGRNIPLEEHGRGLNEAVTEHLTIHQLYDMDEAKGQAAERQGAYAQGVALAEMLENILGEDAVRGGFYGGHVGELTQQFDALAGKEGAFRAFEDCMDRLLSDDPFERVDASAEALEILCELDERSARR